MIPINLKPNIARDGEISDLIKDVQSYAKPAGSFPSVPIDTSPAGRPFVESSPPDLTGPDRSTPPSWFERPEVGQEEPGDDALISDIIDLPPLPDHEEQKISEAGTEALAFYAPFHFYPQPHWGIYIRDFGLIYLATKFLKRRSLTTADNWVIDLAREFLFAHEYFHFRTEIAVSRYEISCSKTQFIKITFIYIIVQTGIPRSSRNP